MRLITAAALLWTVTAQADEVTLVDNDASVKILIGDEVLSVYLKGQGYNKPFMYPLAAPGAVERLVDASDRRVWVAQERAALKSPGEAATAEFGAVLEIERVERPWLKIAGEDLWIHQRDVVPLSGMITRMLQAEASREYDHLHHKGIWLSIDEVNGIRYWAEQGVIRNAGVEVLRPSGNPARFRVTNHWLGNEGRPLLVETTQISVFPNRLLIYDIDLKAADQSVTFHDTKEGLFAIRLSNEMRESTAGGPVTGCNGVVGSKQLWGHALPWIDYAGPVSGEMVGVTLMDYPDNFRPSRYHVRDYGLFAINPFGEAAYTGGQQPEQPLTLEPGNSVRLRYGLYVHRGDAASGDVAGAYEQFVEAAR